MKRFITAALIMALLLPMAAQGGGVLGAGSSGGSSGGGGGGGGGGGTRLSLESFIIFLESWKQQDPERFDYLRTIISKQPFTTSKYLQPAAWVYYPSKNLTINRSDEVRIGALIRNDNPIEIRRAVYLYAEIQEPGDKSFRPVKAGSQIVQVNEYNDKTNTTDWPRYFPELSSFRSLKEVGQVKIRVKATDGLNTWYSSDQASYPQYNYYNVLTLDVINSPPEVNNTTMTVTEKAKWDDVIIYNANLADREQDQVNVTLHVYQGDSDEGGMEITNITKRFLTDTVESPIAFSTKEFRPFTKNDSGKNYSYSYSAYDGINTTWSLRRDGPQILQDPQIKVLGFSSESEEGNYYWWQNYNFNMQIKSLNEGDQKIVVKLYTSTPAHPERFCGSMDVGIPGNGIADATFSGIRPFDVADCGQPFKYYFMYSVPDDSGETISPVQSGQRAISTKVVQYDIYDKWMISNLLLMVLASLFLGIVMEKKLFRKGRIGGK